MEQQQVIPEKSVICDKYLSIAELVLNPILNSLEDPLHQLVRDLVMKGKWIAIEDADWPHAFEPKVSGRTKEQRELILAIEDRMEAEFPVETFGLRDSIDVISSSQNGYFIGIFIRENHSDERLMKLLGITP